MADTKISGLTAVTTPASTDEFAVNQGGVSKKETRAQLHSLETGEHLVLPADNDAVTPALAFGDGDTGLYEETDDTLWLAFAGVQKTRFDANGINFETTTTPIIRNTTRASANPCFNPSRNDQDTGLGSAASDQCELVAGAQVCISVAEVGAAPQVGFYGTAPISKQTGVAVTAAGIHAALVALGLIT